MPDELALSERFGVSRTVVREAIKVLASKGLVETRPKVGTQVRPRRSWNLLDSDVLAWRYEVGPDEGFLDDISEVRSIIEPPAAAFTAERATVDEVDGILAWCSRMEAAAAEDGDDYIDADMAFHTAILDACHNDLLAQLLTALIDHWFLHEAADQHRVVGVLVEQRLDILFQDEPDMLAIHLAQRGVGNVFHGCLRIFIEMLLL